MSPLELADRILGDPDCFEAFQRYARRKGLSRRVQRDATIVLGWAARTRGRPRAAVNRLGIDEQLIKQYRRAFPIPTAAAWEKLGRTVADLAASVPTWGGLGRRLGSGLAGWVERDHLVELRTARGYLLDVPALNRILAAAPDEAADVAFREFVSVEDDLIRGGAAVQVGRGRWIDGPSVPVPPSAREAALWHQNGVAVPYVHSERTAASASLGRLLGFGNGTPLLLSPQSSLELTLIGLQDAGVASPELAAEATEIMQRVAGHLAGVAEKAGDAKLAAHLRTPLKAPPILHHSQRGGKMKQLAAEAAKKKLWGYKQI